MTHSPFTTVIEEDAGVLSGPWRSPRQMLAAQAYDGHASIHDDATAQKLGFKGGTIEGPTHFSQFAPLAWSVWGNDWFSFGCLSVQYRTAVYEGERARAFMERPEPGARLARIWMQNEAGAEVLRGTASMGDAGPTALEQRLTTLSPPAQPVILRDIRPGMRTERLPVRMALNQNMGELYPFTLAQKLDAITEGSDLYDPRKAPAGKPAIIPIEMVSVLIGSVGHVQAWPTKGPVVGLFADQEIRMLKGPLLVDHPYEIEREVVALSGSKRTESMWVRTTVFEPGATTPTASMLLNQASLIDSYAPYEAEKRALYGA